MGDETDSCGLRIVESIWFTSEADRGLLMMYLSSCINVLIHFSASIIPLHPFLPRHLFPSVSSPAVPLFSIHFLSKSPEHLFGLVMGAQLSLFFPYEGANNLVCGP